MTDNQSHPDDSVILPHTAETLPRGDYAIVEVMGHSTMVGRVSEIERFGTKMMQIEPLFRGFMLGPVFIGGSSLYRVTPCDRAAALDQQARGEWELPASVRAIIPDYAQPGPIWPPTFLEAHVNNEDRADTAREAGL